MHAQVYGLFYVLFMILGGFVQAKALKLGVILPVIVIIQTASNLHVHGIFQTLSLQS